MNDLRIEASRLFLLLLLATCVAMESTQASATSPTQVLFTVHAGDSARMDTPIVVDLPDPLIRSMKVEPAGWSLKEVVGKEKRGIPSQILSGEQPQLAWVLTGETAANADRLYIYSNVGSADEQAEKSGITVTESDGVLEIHCDEKPVLRYHMAHIEPPEGADPKYGRSAYIHPVWTPGGAVVTDAFPPDHLHQNGIFLAHTKTSFEGRTPNFWDLLGGGGFVRFAEKLAVTEGSVCGGFLVRNEHVDAGVEGGKVALDEAWDVRVWQTSDDDGQSVYRFDITSTLRCASDSPLKLLEYHYGGMAIRGARNWVDDEVSLVTSDGQNRIEGNHARVPWVDLSGKIADADDNRWAGVTVFTDPANFRFPEPVRLHPSMPYFVYTPSVLGDWAIEPGDRLVSRYHYVVHDGKLNREQVSRVWQDIAEPPQVEMAIVQ